MELLDLYDIHRNLTGKNYQRGSGQPEGTFRLAVHVCIFNSRGEMLIQKRQPFKKGWSNLWDVSVAGSVVSGESSQVGAQREILEEIGVKVDLSNVRPAFTTCWNFAGKRSSAMDKDECDGHSDLTVHPYSALDKSNEPGCKLNLSDCPDGHSDLTVHPYSALDKSNEPGCKLNLSDCPDGHSDLTVHPYSAGFDDIYVLRLDLDEKALVLQESEVQDVRWAGEDEILEMICRREFIPYEECFIRMAFVYSRKWDLKSCGDWTVQAKR